MSDKITCPVKLTTVGLTTGYAITSPRTGQTIALSRYSLLDPLGIRIRGRIAQAVSKGQHVASFTTDELKAFKQAADLRGREHVSKSNLSWSRGY